MIARMLICFGIISAILISQAHAMNSASKKAVIKESNSHDEYSLIFENLHCLFATDGCPHADTITYTADTHASKLIEAIISRNDNQIIKLIKNKTYSSLLTPSACIIALYYANKHMQPSVEHLLASNFDVQAKLVLDQEIGIGLLLLLSVEYKLEKAFEMIMGCNGKYLRHVPPFCFDRALSMSVERDMDDYVYGLLEHSFIATKLALYHLAGLRFIASKKPYINLVKKIVSVRLIEQNPNL